MPRMVVAWQLKTDTKLVPGSKRCSKCARAKPLNQFTLLPACRGSRARLHSWCKLCVRIGVVMHEQTDVSRARKRKYNVSPEGRESKQKYIKANPEAVARSKAKYQQSERGRLVTRRGEAYRRMDKATTQRGRDKAWACIKRYTAALAALEMEDE